MSVPALEERGGSSAFLCASVLSGPLANYIMTIHMGEYDYLFKCQSFPETPSQIYPEIMLYQPPGYHLLIHSS
jgi:hypothetical protein